MVLWFSISLDGILCAVESWQSENLHFFVLSDQYLQERSFFHDFVKIKN